VLYSLFEDNVGSMRCRVPFPQALCKWLTVAFLAESASESASESEVRCPARGKLASCWKWMVWASVRLYVVRIPLEYRYEGWPDHSYGTTMLQYLLQWVVDSMSHESRCFEDFFLWGNTYWTQTFAFSRTTYSSDNWQKDEKKTKPGKPPKWWTRCKNNLIQILLHHINIDIFFSFIILMNDNCCQFLKKSVMMLFYLLLKSALL